MRRAERGLGVGHRPGGLTGSPDEDDDGGRLGHGPDHAADAHDAQEGEEGLLAAGAGALAGDHGGVLGRPGGQARAAGEVLEGRSIRPCSAGTWGTYIPG